MDSDDAILATSMVSGEDYIPRAHPAHTPDTADSVSTLDVESSGEGELSAKIAPLTLRERIFATLSNPSHSPLAYLVSFYFDGLVALSMVLMCAETVVAWSSTPQQQLIWRVLECALTGNFLVDFVLKTGTARPLREYIFRRPTFLIDILSIAPFFVELVLEQVTDQTTAVKALRVLRLLRFLRLSRIAYENLPDVRLFIQAVRRSRLAIAFLGMYVFGAGLFFASCIYYAETSVCVLEGSDGMWYYAETPLGEPREPCAVQNMFQAWWFTLVTMTTVGYGDTVVVSPWGRILTVLIMIASLIFLSLPAAIFAANLTEMYLERRLIKRLGHHGDGTGKGDINSNVNSNGSMRHSAGSRSPSPQGELLSLPDGSRSMGQSPLTTEDTELDRLLESIDAATKQVTGALSTLSTHVTFIHYQQQQLELLLQTRRRRRP